MQSASLWFLSQYKIRADHFIAKPALSLGLAVVDEIERVSDKGSQCFFHQADLRTKEACEAAAKKALSIHGRVDALIHAAGIFPCAAITETTDEMWGDCMRLHVDAFFYLSRHLTPCMVERGSGTLIAIASNYGVVGAANSGAYTASKAAVIGLCKSMALELAPQQVRVNCICPGATNTSMLGDQEAAARYAQSSPSRVLVQPEDVANAAVYLTSPAGRMVRGVELLVDGAETAGFKDAS